MERPPNFLFLVGEDTGRHMGCYGDSFARTPHLDRLAADGCRFTQAFATCPVCAPSRASLVTGQYPTKIGTHLMRCRLKNPPPLFTHALIEAGYQVNWTNKTDFNFEDPTDFRTEASDWEEALATGALNDKPFFLYFNDTITHESHMWPPEVKANHSGLEHPSGKEPETDDATLDDLPGLRVPPYLPDTRTTRASLRRYYNNLTSQDRTWGRLLAALDRSGVADRTIVIYLSDHGRGLVREKRWCYEAGIHQPLIVRAPESMNLVQPGSVRDDLISWVDLAPTISSLAGLPIPPDYDGRIFLGPETQPEPATVFAGRDRMDASYDLVRVARDRRFLYLKNDYPEIPYAQRGHYMEISPVTREVRELHARGELSPNAGLWMQPNKPPEELYDTNADPDCLNNLAGQPNYENDLVRLRKACAQWREATHDLGRTPEAELVKKGLYQPWKQNPASETSLPKHLDPDSLYATRRSGG